MQKLEAQSIVRHTWPTWKTTYKQGIGTYWNISITHPSSTIPIKPTTNANAPQKSKASL